MRNILLTISLAALVVAAPAPVFAGDALSCAYNPSNHAVSVQVSGDNVNVTIERTASGQIMVAGSWCESFATVNNTDSIQVLGSAADQGILIDLANGGFKPGRTDEAGSSDEIEFSVNLGAGSQDALVIVGTATAQTIDLGQGNTGLGLFRHINLNANEKNGVDTDVFMFGIERTTVEAGGGKDKVRAQGKFGAGPQAFGLPLYVYAGTGNDEIRGGSAEDHLFAEQGSDKVWGNGAPDHIYLDDGVDGNDIGHGGAGADFCFKDPGDSCD